MTDSGDFITDIHTHVLPDVDDGPANLEDAVCLIQAHHEAGTDRVFCTSHLGSPHFDNTPKALSLAFSSLFTRISGSSSEGVPGNHSLHVNDHVNDQVSDLDIPNQETHGQGGRSDEAAPALADADEKTLTIAMGAELRVNQQLTDLLLRDEVTALGNTSYVLLEYPNSQLNERMLDVVHELHVRGYRTIMAHPERSIIIQKDPSWIDTLLEAGLLLQLTAQCLEKIPSARTHPADRLAWHILERGAAAVIASDAHDPHYRPPGLLKAYETISERLGSEVSDALIANANAIWDNQPISAVAVPKRKRGLFGKLL